MTHDSSVHACDTHMHFYDDRYPAAERPILRPPNAVVSDYQVVRETLGLGRVIVVQPTTYGLDNSCQSDAIAELGECARGVAVVGADASRDQIQRLHKAGFRGARFHMLPGGAVAWDELDVVARSIAPFGWHIQLQLNGRELGDRYEQLAALPVPLVIDHVGRFMPPVTPDDPLAAPLWKLMDGGAHIKLSAPYESATDSTHQYEMVGLMVDHLVANYPERLLWASNWPHPGQADPPSLDDLARLRDRWLPTAELGHQVLVTNPERLYFGSNSDR